MRIFVTGATGFVGFAVVRELLANGHRVLGLTRSEEGAAALAAAGAEVVRGSLGDFDSLRRGAAAADGVIHTAFNHDFSKFAQNAEEGRHAIETQGSVLEGSERPLLVTSGTAFLANGRTATEEDRPRAPSGEYPVRRRRRRILSRPAGYGQPPFGCRLPFTGRAITASSPSSSASRARKARRPMWAAASTAGPPCIASMPHDWPAR